MYARFKKLARQSGDPVRLAKVLGIERQAKRRISQSTKGVYFPTPLEIQESILSSKPLFLEFYEILGLAGDIRVHGAFRCRQMINRPLPFVTSYAPSTDPDWPA